MRRVLFLLSKNIDIDSKFSLEEKKEKPQTKIPAIPILLFTFYSLLASEQTPALIASLIDSGSLKITNLDRLIFTKNGEFTI